MGRSAKSYLRLFQTEALERFIRTESDSRNKSLGFDPDSCTSHHATAAATKHSWHRLTFFRRIESNLKCQSQRISLTLPPTLLLPDILSFPFSLLFALELFLSASSNLVRKAHGSEEDSPSRDLNRAGPGLKAH